MKSGGIEGWEVKEGKEAGRMEQKDKGNKSEGCKEGREGRKLRRDGKIRNEGRKEGRKEKEERKRKKGG